MRKPCWRCCGVLLLRPPLLLLATCRSADLAPSPSPQVKEVFDSLIASAEPPKKKAAKKKKEDDDEEDSAPPKKVKKAAPKKKAAPAVAMPGDDD